MLKICLISMLTTLLAACGGKSAITDKSGHAMNQIVTASADSLYDYMRVQMQFGPRVPGTKPHADFREYLIYKLLAFGVDSVMVQEAPVTTFDNTNLTAYNMMGSINIEAPNRVLILTHYDCRPWADHDADPAKHTEPVPGANDGGSGTAVMLELARLLAPILPDSLGLDLLFVDVEDWGETNGDESSWCLGTQEWVKDMPYAQSSRSPLAGNKPRYAILLDMVGGRNAQFPRELFSQRLALDVLNKVWGSAHRSGFAHRFPNKPGGAIVDDHLYVNDAGIPCIDIIESNNEQTGAFNPTWHTTDDNLENIDAETLRMVAQILLNLMTDSPI